MRYLEEFADKRSIADDKNHLRKLDPYLRGNRLDQINVDVLWSFIRDRRERDKVANASINRALKIVRRMLNVAHQDWNWLHRVPRVRMLTDPKRRIQFLTREEADRLIANLPVHLRSVVRFALATGCRMSDVGDLALGMAARGLRSAVLPGWILGRRRMAKVAAFH